MKKLLNFINTSLHTPTWLFFFLVAIVILRIPSFFEPYSYGDEMIYLTLGEAVRQGVPLYESVHDNKPPLLYLLAAAAGSLFWFKAILAIWHIVTIFLFWKLSEVLFSTDSKATSKLGKLRAQQISTVIFGLLTTIPLLEGNIVNSEMFMIGLTISALLILLTKVHNFKNLFSAGILFSLAALFKIPAAFDLPVIIFFWLITQKLTKQSLKKNIINTVYLLTGFLLPIGLTFIWYYFQGALSQYIVAAYLQNFGYVSSWRPTDAQKPFLVKNAPMIIRSLIVMVGMVLLYWKRKVLSKNYIFLTVWLLFALFAVTLSERPYPHYLIQAVAPVSFLLTILVTSRSMEQVLVILPLTLSLVVPAYYKFWHYPTLPYYSRFVRLVSGQLSKEAYLDTFGGEVVRNYKVSNFIVSSTNKKDKVFVAGNSSAVYALSRHLPPIKYIADYHIKDFSSDAELVQGLHSNLPKLIVILPDATQSKLLRQLINENYLLINTIDGALIYSKLNPETKSRISS